MGRVWDPREDEEDYLRSKEIIRLFQSGKALEARIDSMDKPSFFEKYMGVELDPVVDPFSGELSGSRIEIIENPNYDPYRVRKLNSLRESKEDEIRSKILKSEVFKEGSHFPSKVTETFEIPEYGSFEVVVENPEKAKTKSWVNSTKRINRLILDDVRRSMPRRELLREVELVEPTYDGFSYLRKYKVKSRAFDTLTKNVENQLGKAIVRRREEAKKANKIVFEFPDTQVAHTYPATYYRPKFMKLFNTFSKGTYSPKYITEDYILDTKGRWPKRDGHHVVLVGSPKSHSKWGETIIVEDVEIGDRLRVNIKYILPPEDKILKWEK